jgi:hypothetical protein
MVSSVAIKSALTLALSIKQSSAIKKFFITIYLVR